MACTTLMPISAKIKPVTDDPGRMLQAQPAGQARDARCAWRPNTPRAQRLLREVTALYTCGPGGGVRTSLRATKFPM